MPDTTVSLPQVDAQEIPGFVESPVLVRVSDSVKAIGPDGRDHLISISMESVPLPAAADAIIDLVVTMKAGLALADFPVPQQPAALPIAPGVGTIAPSAAPATIPQAAPAPQEAPGEQVIPASEITYLKRADTENGAVRVKFYTAKFHLHGVVCWADQQNERVKQPLAAANIPVNNMEAGKQYSVPPHVKAIRVRFKPGSEGGRPTPDRVLEIVTS